MSKIFFKSADSKQLNLISKFRKVFTLQGKLHLKLGGVLDNIEVAYEDYGKLNVEKSNVVLICHAISGDSHVAKHSEKDIIGWWDSLVGAGKYIDTNQYYVLCTNILGSCRGTTGPHSINPATGQPFGNEFPRITVEDMVEAQKKLLDALGIYSLQCVIGGSLGGFQAMQWAVQFPDRVKGCVVLASSAYLSSQALAFDIVGRNAIFGDPNYSDGQYYNQEKKPAVGLAIARMLGHITYLSKESMHEKFAHDKFLPRDISTSFEKKFSVGSYLAYQGDKFVERFDANSYVSLSLAMDTFNLGDTPKKLKNSLRKTQCKWLVISYTSDWLFPAAQAKEIVSSLLALDKAVSYCNIPSNCGHDSFLLDSELEDHGGPIQAFLQRLSGEIVFTGDVRPHQKQQKTSIFFDKRMDFQFIADLVPKNSKILDLGCQNGELLQLLHKTGKANLKAIGIELRFELVKESLKRGLEVIHSDLNQGLSSFYEKQFDLVILSHTLQSITKVEYLIQEMLRISKKTIVSFPNFAFRPLREMLYKQGRAPRSKGWYSYQWHNTPNSRFPSILDFQEFCVQKKIKIEKSIFLDSVSKKEIKKDPNLNADSAVCVISK